MMNQKIVSKMTNTNMIYLDQPNSGGPAQEKAMIQVKTTPAAA